MTKTDATYATRFDGEAVTTFAAKGNESLGNYTPAQSVLNTGMMADIGRVTCYQPDLQENFYARFMKSPLARGDSDMVTKFGEISSRAYDPLAPDTALFDGSRPDMLSSVATKNLSRQIRLEVNDRYLKQMCQTEEMIGDAMACLMASTNACYKDDMWTASKAYFSGDTRNAQSAQLNIMTNKPSDAGFANEINELIWKITQNQFGYKSTSYNASHSNTKSTGVHIALKKSCEYPAFKKLYSETFHPDYLKTAQTIDYVDDFATPAGMPSGAGELIGMIVDERAFRIVPMPEAVVTESFRNPARLSTMYATTYEYAFGHAPFFNVGYIFAPQ